MDKTPAEALDDFLEVLRREFHDNPELALRAVKALGGTIEVRGQNAAAAVNPLELVETQGEEAATQTLSSFSTSELKKIAKNHNLATAIDLKGRNERAMVELLVRRASNKISERRGSTW
ncbi:MAG: hypothetical protein AAFV59_02710 [Pseudomonadota bacterium]